MYFTEHRKETSYRGLRNGCIRRIIRMGRFHQNRCIKLFLCYNQCFRCEVNRMNILQVYYLGTFSWQSRYSSKRTRVRTSAENCNILHSLLLYFHLVCLRTTWSICGETLKVQWNGGKITKFENHSESFSTRTLSVVAINTRVLFVCSVATSGVKILMWFCR